jgi:hypothetical protein
MHVASLHLFRHLRMSLACIYFDIYEFCKSELEAIFRKVARVVEHVCNCRGSYHAFQFERYSLVAAWCQEATGVHTGAVRRGIRASDRMPLPLPPSPGTTRKHAAVSRTQANTTLHRSLTTTGPIRQTRMSRRF